MTVAGLPVESWVLVAAAVGIGLAIEIAFFRAHRRSGRRRPPPDARLAGPPEGGGPREQDGSGR